MQGISVALLTAVMLSGCLGASTPDGMMRPEEWYTDRWPVVFGLGLELPQELPGAGAPLEGAQLVAQWESRILNISQAVEDRCGREMQPGSLERAWDRGVRGVVRALLSICQGRIDTASDPPSMEAPVTLKPGEEPPSIVTPTLTSNERAREVQELGARHERVSGMLQREWWAAAALRFGPDVVAVEFQAALLNNMRTRPHALADHDAWLRHFEENGTTQDLRDRKMKIDSLESVHPAYMLLVRELHPPADGCVMMHPTAVEADIRQNLRVGRDIAAGWNIDPQDDEEMRDLGGHLRTLDEYERSFENATRLGWWPVVLGIQSDLSYEIAIMERYGSEPLPTFEEARYLWAKHRNETYDLWTRGLAEDQVGQYVHGEGASLWVHMWQQVVRQAVRGLALHEYEWTFDRVAC